MNRIVKVVLTLTETGEWLILVTKEFSPENGGGEHTFTGGGGYQIHRALGVAAEMVTLHPATNPKHIDSLSKTG